MRFERYAWSGSSIRGRSATVAAALVVAMLAGSGGASAAAAGRGGGPTARTGPPAAGTISTVAGGVGGPGRATRVALAFGLAPDALVCGVTFGAGRLYITTGETVRQVTPGTGQLTTPAGMGNTGPLGDGGPAAKAGMDTCAVAVDHSGNLVLADLQHQRIRVVAAGTGTFYGQSMTAGHIYTIAGTGRAGFSGDGGPATKAEINNPSGVAVDAAGNVLISDGSNQRVRMVAEQTGTFYGQAVTAGNIYTVAGDGTRGSSGDGGPAAKAELGGPRALAVDAAGDLVIAAGGNDRIRVVAATTGTHYGQAMTAGHIYTVAGTGKRGFNGDGGPATGAELSGPRGVAVDAAGDLVIADTFNDRIRVVAATTGTHYGQAMTAGHIYTVAGTGKRGFNGDGGPATGAELALPDGVAVDAAGNLLIADSLSSRIRAVAATTGTFYGKAMTAGHIYTAAGNGTFSFSGDGVLATSAEFHSPSQAAADSAGNLVIADSSNNRIRVAAAHTGTFYGVSMTAGRLYTVAGSGKFGFNGDGGPATSAELDHPEGVAVDGAGNLLIADSFNNRIRVVAAHTGTFYGQNMTAGHIYTVAGTGTAGFSGDGGPSTSAELDNPQGMAVDGAGNLVIADSFNNRIRVAADHTGTFYGVSMTAGDIYTVAGTGTEGFSGDGGPATKAEVRFPGQAALDGNGNLVIADSDNNRIRVVAAHTGTFYGQSMTAGHIYTVAGTGILGFSGDGGPADSAELGEPHGVAVDGAGNLVIADSFNGRARVVAARTGTFYGISMTQGDIYTVAGDGSGGFSGDGGPATGAEIAGPEAVAVDAAGNLVITDTGNGRIRMVAP